MRELLEAMPGVASAEVSYEKENAVVKFDSAAIKSRAIVNMLEANGYKSWETSTEKSNKAKP